MTKNITSPQMKSVIENLIDNALKVTKDAGNSREAFYEGEKAGYYEILDTIKNQMMVDDRDLTEFGLDISLEQALP